MTAKKLTAKQELATVRHSLKGMSERVISLGEENAALKLELGPRCQHRVEGADARNVRLMEARGVVVAALNARIRELEALLAPYLRADAEAVDKRRAKAYRR